MSAAQPRSRPMKQDAPPNQDDAPQMEDVPYRSRTPAGSRSPPFAFRVLVAFLCVLVAVASVRQRLRVLEEAARRRTEVHAVRLRLERSQIECRSLESKRPRLRLLLKIGTRAEERRLAKLRELTRAIETRQQREYTARSLALKRQGIGVGPAQRTVWHAMAADGSCPAEVPHWEWRHLLDAAMSDEPRARHDALAALGAQSRLAWGEMQRIAQRYRGILDNPEFVGILNVSHPPCGGRRFASLRGDRVLHMDCAVEAQYAVDDARELKEYRGPVRLAEGESIAAFCGGASQRAVTSPLHPPAGAVPSPPRLFWLHSVPFVAC